MDGCRSAKIFWGHSPSHRRELERNVRLFPHSQLLLQLTLRSAFALDLIHCTESLTAENITGIAEEVVDKFTNDCVYLSSATIDGESAMQSGMDTYVSAANLLWCFCHLLALIVAVATAVCQIVALLLYMTISAAIY